MNLHDRIDLARAQSVRWASLNALAFEAWDSAHEVAHHLARLEPSQRGPLHGMLVTVKDLFALPGTPLKAGSRAPLPEALTVPGLQATAVRRLRDAGAIILGKTNMHEVALGATGENEHTGDVLNPFDPRHQAGGSSSGAGVAVACGIGEAALGTDTGGSIRIPAAFCGVVGFKPSFGAVPLDGALCLSWSFDHAGPLARDVASARAMAETLMQRSLRHGGEVYRPKIAVPSAWLRDRIDERVARGFDLALQALSKSGARLETVECPALDLAWQCYSTIVRAQAAHVHRAALGNPSPGFSSAVLQPLRLGQAISAQDYLQARALRAQVRAELRALLTQVDALALPTTAIAPPMRGTLEVVVAGQPRQVRELVLGQTLPFNVAGVPALSLPIQAARPPQPHEGIEQWPVALQLVARFDADARLLALGQWAETVFAGAL
jgi:aspartyl-tRNA(Asn)/glutamyl-tRNA(Gln) amidotransferase subunit A